MATELARWQTSPKRPTLEIKKEMEESRDLSKQAVQDIEFQGDKLTVNRPFL
jgi:hypothetical protein